MSNAQGMRKDGSVTRLKKLVIASHNPGKVKELTELLSGYGVSAVSAVELGLDDPEETGETFEQNAQLKARSAAVVSDLPALGDDSGLIVDALGGRPGIRSARWAGKERDFNKAMGLVEEKLRLCSALSDQQRTASFLSVLCLCYPDGSDKIFTGKVDGLIVWPSRGVQGFGYDPIFLPKGHDRTFGEMTTAEKHGSVPGQEPLSHRARAFAAFARYFFDI